MSWVRSLGQTLVTSNVWGKSCTGGITLKNVLDLSVLHSFLTRFNRKTLFRTDFHLFYSKVEGTCHGDIETVDVIHGQHRDGDLLPGPGRGEDELWVISAEGVTPRHQVVLGQGDPLNTC